MDIHTIKIIVALALMLIISAIGMIYSFSVLKKAEDIESQNKPK